MIKPDRLQLRLERTFMQRLEKAFRPDEHYFINGVSLFLTIPDLLSMFKDDLKQTEGEMIVPRLRMCRFVADSMDIGEPVSISDACLATFGWEEEKFNPYGPYSGKTVTMTHFGRCNCIALEMDRISCSFEHMHRRDVNSSLVEAIRVWVGYKEKVIDCEPDPVTPWIRPTCDVLDI